MLFWTGHANFRRVENDIYDPSDRIIKNPLNSTIFWTRHLNSAIRQLNSATRQILHWNIVVYLDKASSQNGDASKMHYNLNGLPYSLRGIIKVSTLLRNIMKKALRDV